MNYTAEEMVEIMSTLRPGAVWGYSGGVLTWHDTTQTEPTAQEITSVVPTIRAVLQRKPLVESAKMELDMVTGPRGQVLRATIAGIPLTQSWKDYIVALRAIVSGADTTSSALPPRPAYMPGT